MKYFGYVHGWITVSLVVAGLVSAFAGNYSYTYMLWGYPIGVALSRDIQLITEKA